MSTWHRTVGRSLLFSATAAVLVAAPAAGQEPLGQEVESDRKCLCVDELHELPARLAFTADRRARLGIMLGEPTELAGRNGVRLASVPEGGAAHRAGLRQGDVLVALNGEELGDQPAATVLERMDGVEPGDTVTVTFLREGEERSARVVTEPAPAFGPPDHLEHFRLRGPRPDAPRGMRAPGAPRPEIIRRALVHRRVAAAGLDLVPLNAGLGEYFGTDRGVLVLEVDADSPLGLRPGDVILAIGGRDVRDPTHVRSMLASYRQDEEIRFRIMREKRELDVTGKRGES